MAITQEDLDTLQKAIVAGELTIRRSDGEMITYNSKDELIKAYNWAKKEYSAQTSSTAGRVPRFQQATFSD